jgi:hypothetical protein
MLAVVPDPPGRDSSAPGSLIDEIVRAEATFTNGQLAERADRQTAGQAPGRAAA